MLPITPRGVGAAVTGFYPTLPPTWELRGQVNTIGGVIPKMITDCFRPAITSVPYKMELVKSPHPGVEPEPRA